MDFNFSKTFDVLKRLILPVLLLIILLALSKSFINFEYNRITSLISIMIHGVIGVLIYLVITYKNKSLKDVFGEEIINKILRKLHFKS